jgi:hypothetical protein
MRDSMGFTYSIVHQDIVFNFFVIICVGEEDRDEGHATGEPGQRASLLSHGSAQLSRGSPHTYVYTNINSMKKCTIGMT